MQAYVVTNMPWIMQLRNNLQIRNMQYIYIYALYASIYKNMQTTNMQVHAKIYLQKYTNNMHKYTNLHSAQHKYAFSKFSYVWMNMQLYAIICSINTINMQKKHKSKYAKKFRQFCRNVHKYAGVPWACPLSKYVYTHTPKYVINCICRTCQNMHSPLCWCQGLSLARCQWLIGAQWHSEFKFNFPVVTPGQEGSVMNLLAGYPTVTEMVTSTVA